VDAITDHGSRVVLTVEGLGKRRDRQFDNWLSVNFQRSVEGFVGSATLTLPYSNRTRFANMVEKKAFLFLHFNDQTVHQTPLMTGYVKSVKVVHKAEGPMITIQLRDKTIDLVECHPVTSPPMDFGGGAYSIINPALITPAQFVNTSLGNICRAFCTPFGIDVVDSTDNLDLFTEGYETEETQTVFSQIAKFCKMRGSVPTTDARGRLNIGQMAYQFRTSETSQVLSLSNPGETWNTITHSDVLSFEHNADFTERFSDYKVVYNQLPEDSPLGGPLDAEQWSQDGGVRRWRPKVIRPDLAYKGDKENYATWLSQTQKGGSNTFTAQLRYWFKRKEGSSRIRIFEIGDLVNIDLPKWGYKGELVITSVAYQLDGHGARTLTVTLKHKDTYKPAPREYIYQYEGVMARSLEGEEPIYSNEVDQYMDDANSGRTMSYPGHPSFSHVVLEDKDSEWSYNE